MDKHKRERAIFQMVYDEGVFESVSQQETPDYVLRHPGSHSSFGVEITELYETEADARIIHHPRYLSELLAGGTQMRPGNGPV